MFRLPFEGPRLLREFRWKRFFLTKTRRHFRVLMREGRVLMQDVVATYHDEAASCNWFHQSKDFREDRVPHAELTQGGATI
jgi:hypothetical protein